MQQINMVGYVFENLLVLKESSKTDKSRQKFWWCKCICGNEKEIGGRNLRRGDIVSCGCFGKMQRKKTNTKHGMHSSVEYKTWDGMIQRCTNKNRLAYKNYGGRGILVCEEWKTFENFLLDMGEKPSPFHSIERINNEGNYCKENCKWATSSEQSRNQRIFKTNTSGITGVSWNKRKNKWRANIYHNSKSKHLGYFESKQDAYHARKNAEKILWGKG
jgi:hypothetical protein